MKKKNFIEIASNNDFFKEMKRVLKENPNSSFIINSWTEEDEEDAPIKGMCITPISHEEAEILTFFGELYGLSWIKEIEEYVLSNGWFKSMNDVITKGEYTYEG